MKERITEFLKIEGISPAEFADRIGVQRSSVSHVLNGRNYPSASFIQKMLETYKTLNPRWLLLGEGVPFEPKAVSFREPGLFQEVVQDGKLNPTVKAGISPIKSPDNQINLPNDNVPAPSSALPGITPSVELNPVGKVTDIIDYLADNKDISRIVLFFNDKTFSVYTPSK